MKPFFFVVVSLFLLSTTAGCRKARCASGTVLVGDFCRTACSDDNDCLDADPEFPHCIESTGACSECPENHVLVGMACQDRCTNVTRDGDETDVDCGGAFCTPCSINKSCILDSDCATGFCTDGQCAAAQCEDGIKNGNETDIDCGGVCPSCANGKGCSTADDCLSRACAGMLCVASSCTDAAQNNDETDVDCGGSCAPCADGKGCVEADDCESDLCQATVCQAPECGDGVTNGSEDCDDIGESMVCDADCSAALCGDGVFNISAGEDCDEGPHALTCHAGCRSVIQIVVGEFHSCALLDDGSIKCWGDNSQGQLGLGDTGDRGDQSGEMGDALPAIDLGTERTATAIAAGDTHSCALLDNGSLKCWGDNFFGQLGLSDTEDRGDEPDEMGDDLPSIDLGTGRTATAIAAMGSYSCALLDNGSLKCWGSNSQGQLGLGDIEHRGDEPDEMGDDLPTVDLGNGHTAVALTAGSIHSCALLDDGSVKCWGDNGAGQLGLGDTEDRGDDPNEMGDDLPSVDFGTGRSAMEIVAGGNHTCALLDNGSLKCWGANFRGELGLGDTEHRGDEFGEMGDPLPAVILGTGRKATIVVAGGDHTCALLDDGSFKCWGRNTTGHLGLGDTEGRGDDPDEMGDDLPSVDFGIGRSATEAVAGANHTCAFLDDGSFKCWGWNVAGQLGLGDTDSRGDQPGEVAAIPGIDL